MIRKVIIQNIKKIARQEFEIPQYLVIAGPNNSGKTTVLQAIAAWSEVASQWRENNSDLVRERDGNYPTTNLNVLDFNSISLADFNHLWKDKDVGSPASIRLHTDHWEVGFELLYKEGEVADARPTKDIKEDDLEEYLEKPLVPVYIPPFSQLEKEEAPLMPVAVNTRLASARGSSVLRNLLLAVSRDAQKWKKLQDVVESFFGYRLSPPSGGSDRILTRYQHSEQGQLYDLNSAASGFLQVLMVYASLLHKDAAVVLIDEPDAHLHILLQEKMYRDLSEYARSNKAQLIIATHSEQIINAARSENLRLLTSTGELKPVKDSKKLIRTLRLENTDIMLANTEPGILYVEGKTDMDILREWAKILGHPLLPFLESPFWRLTAEKKGKNGFPLSHFEPMRLVVPKFRGFELRDGDKRARGTSPEGMKSCCWERCEIENYLIHPAAIMRFVKQNNGADAAKAEAYMKDQLPPAAYKPPFEHIDFLRDLKGKKFISDLMQEAGIDIKESDYYQIAAQMKEKEIHPEVSEKLDAIAEHFGIQT